MFDKLASNTEVYRTMNVPTEFHLGKTVDMPTLVTSGRHNEAMPFIAGMVQRGITGAKWVVFEN